MSKKCPKFTVSDGKLVLVLEPADKGWYVVTSPLDPELNTQAKTVEEAFEMAYDARNLLKTARADVSFFRNQAPKPSRR